MENAINGQLRFLNGELLHCLKGTVHFMYFDAIYPSSLFWCVASDQYKGTSSVVKDQIYIKQWQCLIPEIMTWIFSWWAVSRRNCSNLLADKKIVNVKDQLRRSPIMFTFCHNHKLLINDNMCVLIVLYLDSIHTDVRLKKEISYNLW